MSHPPSLHALASSLGVMTGVRWRLMMNGMSKHGAVASSSVESEEVLTFEEMTAILQGVAGAARSGYGIARALSDIARTLRVCPWVEGELRMELDGERDRATLHVYSEQGGVRERVLAPVIFGVPLDEIEAAVHATLTGFAPFSVTRHKGKVVFASTPLPATVPPPNVEVAPDSLEKKADLNPHTKPTIKRPMFVLPEEAAPPSRSGTHLRQNARRDPRREDD